MLLIKDNYTTEYLVCDKHFIYQKVELERLFNRLLSF
jgi:hypothetical protein